MVTDVYRCLMAWVRCNTLLRATVTSCSVSQLGQYLTYNQMSGVLNETQFTNYNILVDACLSAGAYCEIYIHKDARYDGKVSCIDVI